MNSSQPARFPNRAGPPAAVIAPAAQPAGHVDDRGGADQQDRHHDRQQRGGERGELRLGAVHDRAGVGQGNATGVPHGNGRKPVEHPAGQPAGQDGDDPRHNPYPDRQADVEAQVFGHESRARMRDRQGVGDGAPGADRQHVERELATGPQRQRHGHRHHQHEHAVEEDRDREQVGGDHDRERHARRAVTADDQEATDHLVGGTAFGERHADDRGHRDHDRYPAGCPAEPFSGELDCPHELALVRMPGIGGQPLGHAAGQECGRHEGQEGMEPEHQHAHDHRGHAGQEHHERPGVGRGSGEECSLHGPSCRGGKGLLATAARPAPCGGSRFPVLSCPAVAPGSLRQVVVPGLAPRGFYGRGGCAGRITRDGNGGRVTGSRVRPSRGGSR